jgi:Regulator of volume decrease after cellular swelling
VTSGSRGTIIKKIQKTNHSTTMEQGDSDDNTTVRKGLDAGLSFLHQKDATALSCAIANLELILGPLSVKLSILAGGVDDEEEEEDPSASPNQFDTAASSGFSMLVTKQAVLFWRISNSDDPNEFNADLLVHGSCIDLQAITSSSTAADGDSDDRSTTATGIYLQVSTDKEGTMLEINVQPDGGPEICQEIYRAVAKLIELHPHAIFSDEEDEEDGDDDDDMIVASEFVVTPASETATASEAEREHMLERLSNLLIVPPEYEIIADEDEVASDDDDGVVEGQFDDADDDDDPFL